MPATTIHHARIEPTGTRYFVGAIPNGELYGGVNTLGVLKRKKLSFS